jgi:DNA-binding response OmpR family regulator
MDVALIQWPSDEVLRLEMAGIRHPRLLLVDSDAEPPEVTDVLEDWVRLPVSRADRNARIRTLELRAQGHAVVGPQLRGDGTIEYRGVTIQLSALHGEILKPMIERFGSVVSRGTLAAAAWPDGLPSDNNLDVTIGRLRRQLVPADLRIRTVRSRGYLLCDASR